MNIEIDSVKHKFDLFFEKKGSGIRFPNQYFKADGCEVIAILVRNNKSECVCIIDSDDFEKMSMCNWKMTQDSHTTYLSNSKNGMAHRVIMGVSNQNWKDGVVDHINGNGLDNRKNNLRLLTMQESLLSKHTNGFHETKNGYTVTWSENGKKRTKRFAFSRFGGKEKAMSEVKIFRKMIEKTIYKNNKKC